jgi:hypothetical protein
MPSIQTVPPWLRPGPLELDPDPVSVPVPAPAPARLYQTRPEVPTRERDARREIEELRHEIEGLVRGDGDNDNPRDTIDSALESVTRLQVVTANIDACGPPIASFAAPILVALADARLRGHADAIERGMTYTSDNQMQLLRGEK